jgi:hypothetical protein
MHEDSTVEVEADAMRRRAIVALSVSGAVAMAATSLLQLGVIDDLPDPKLRLLGLPFRSREVNLSDDAYVLGLRDGPIALVGFAANVPMMLALDRAPARWRPWISLGFAAKAFGEAVGAVIFFSKMPRKEKAWCVYCIGAAVASVGIFALSIPAAVRALATLTTPRAA